MFKDKHSSIVILLTGFILICFWSMYCQGQGGLEKSDFIRFHVIANSNSQEDQELKLKVRDQVLEEISPKLAYMGSVEESREWILENSEEINDLAESVIKAEGFEYTAQTGIGMRWIPEKTYGNVVMPAGNYQAFTIEIGEGKGDNWWCVMFPPICIIGEGFEENEDLAESFEGTKYEELIEGCLGESPYVLKFKSLEIGENFLKWIKN